MGGGGDRLHALVAAADEAAFTCAVDDANDAAICSMVADDVAANDGVGFSMGGWEVPDAAPPARAAPPPFNVAAAPYAADFYPRATTTVYTPATNVWHMGGGELDAKLSVSADEDDPSNNPDYDPVAPLLAADRDDATSSDDGYEHTYGDHQAHRLKKRGSRHTYRPPALCAPPRRRAPSPPPGATETSCTSTRPPPPPAAGQAWSTWATPAT